MQDAFVIAVEQQAKERLERLSALRKIKPVDMTKLSQQVNTIVVNMSFPCAHFEITQRIFLDDLERGIRSDLKDYDLDIMNPDELAVSNENDIANTGLSTSDILFKEYIESHLSVQLDGEH